MAVTSELSHRSWTRDHNVALWLAALLGGGLAGVGLVWLLIPTPSWGGAGVGWVTGVINAFAGRMINHRAVGLSRWAFMGWGVGVNGLRVLTLVSFFAYVTLSYRDERASFLVVVFATLFLLMVAEVAELFWSQDKGGKQS